MFGVLQAEEGQDVRRRLAEGRQNVDRLGGEVAPLPGALAPAGAPTRAHHLFAGAVVFQNDQVTLLEVQEGRALA